jgi:hypothetical protein
VKAKYHAAKSTFAAEELVFFGECSAIEFPKLRWFENLFWTSSFVIDKSLHVEESCAGD